LIDLSGKRQVAYGSGCSYGSMDTTGNCATGISNTGMCGGGCSPQGGWGPCSTGTCPSWCCTGNTPFYQSAIGCCFGTLDSNFCNNGMGP
jgi:hypothetical protein